MYIHKVFKVLTLFTENIHIGVIEQDKYMRGFDQKQTNKINNSDKKENKLLLIYLPIKKHFRLPLYTLDKKRYKLYNNTQRRYETSKNE